MGSPVEDAREGRRGRSPDGLTIVELVVGALGVVATFVGIATNMPVIALAGLAGACVSFGVVIARAAIGHH